MDDLNIFVSGCKVYELQTKIISYDLIIYIVVSLVFLHKTMAYVLNNKEKESTLISFSKFAVMGPGR